MSQELGCYPCITAHTQLTRTCTPAQHGSQLVRRSRIW